MVKGSKHAHISHTMYLILDHTNSRENLPFLSTFLLDFSVKDSGEFPRFPGKDFSRFCAKLLPGFDQGYGCHLCLKDHLEITVKVRLRNEDF